MAVGIPGRPRDVRGLIWPFSLAFGHTPAVGCTRTYDYRSSICWHRWSLPTSCAPILREATRTCVVGAFPAG